MSALCVGPSWDAWMCRCQKRVQAGYQTSCSLGPAPLQHWQRSGRMVGESSSQTTPMPPSGGGGSLVVLEWLPIQSHHCLEQRRSRNQACVYYIFFLARTHSNIEWWEKCPCITFHKFKKSTQEREEELESVWKRLLPVHGPASCLYLVSITCSKCSGCCSLSGVSSIGCIMQTVKKPLHELFNNRWGETYISPPK